MNYLDEHGYPGAEGVDGKFDGGDTAAILGTLWYFGKALSIGLPWDFEARVPLRHPDKTKWYGQPDRFSRDQLIAVLCGLLRSTTPMSFGTLDMQIATVALFRAHRRRLFLFAWNTRKNGVIETPWKFPDICGPTVWALWIRLFWKDRANWLIRAILSVLDLELVLTALHWRFFRKDNVVRNHLLTTLASVDYIPTWASKFAYRINDFDDLTKRWIRHCELCKEYPTGELFRERLCGTKD